MTTVKLNREGVRLLLQSPEVLGDLTARAERMAAAAGDGFEAESSTTPTRARAAVISRTVAAMEAEASSRALTYAIDAGR